MRRTIAPGDQLWLNLGDIIRNGVPDTKGKTFPADLTWGTYDIREPNRNNDPSLFEGKIIVDKTYGHLAYGCTTCCGDGYPWIQADPETLPVLAQDTLGVWATNSCTGYDDNLTGLFSGWDTNNHAVATMSSTRITGVGAGSTTDFSSGTFNYNNGVSRYCSPKGYTPQGHANVNPTVTISGPSNIPMLKPGYQGSDSISLTATGNPAGGSYSWSAISGQGNISILNATSQTAIIQSVAVGTYTVQVTYTLNGKQGTATAMGRVQQPSSLSVISNTTPTFDCANTGLPHYNTKDRLIQYQVLDTSAAPITAAGMSASETLNVTNNTCAVSGPNPTVGALTFSNGYFPGPDTLQLCSPQCLPANGNGDPTGSCTMNVTQTWNVNGYAVKSDTITYTCPGPPTGAP